MEFWETGIFKKMAHTNRNDRTMVIWELVNGNGNVMAVYAVFHEQLGLVNGYAILVEC